MKKFIVVTLMLLLTFVTFSKTGAFASGEKYVKSLYSGVKVLNEPNVDLENNVLLTLNYGDVLKLKQKDTIVGDDGSNYYIVEVNIENVLQGYVLASFVNLVDNSSPIRNLDANAKTKSEAKIYSKTVDETFEETGETLNAGESIRIVDGYNSSKQYTRIQYKLENGEIAIGYIETSKIQISGVSRSTIGAIIIIVTTVSLVLIVFGIKGKHKKALKKLVVGKK